MAERRMKAGGKPKIVITKKLDVKAACVNGFGSDPAPNLIIVSVTYEDGSPVKGLKTEDFTVVNYPMHSGSTGAGGWAWSAGHPILVPLRHVVALVDELPSAGIDGVYTVEPESEPAITKDVGQTVYAVKVRKAGQSPGTSFSGQTVVAVVMQKRPY